MEEESKEHIKLINDYASQIANLNSEINNLTNKISILDNEIISKEKEMFNKNDELRTVYKLKDQIENKINIFKNKEEYFKTDIKSKNQSIDNLKNQLDK